MVAGAYLRIPFVFIEVTFQAFFAVLAGLLLGPKKSLIALLLYMLLGLFGLPVFAKGGGFAYVLIPSFGFILAFIPGGMLTGFLYKTKKMNKYLSSVLGIIVIYLVGTPYMYLIMTLHLHSDKGFMVLLFSFIPYFIKDIVLSLFGAYLLKYLRF